MASHFRFSLSSVLIAIIVAGFFLGMNVRGQSASKSTRSENLEIKSIITSYGWPFTFYETADLDLPAYERVSPGNPQVKSQTEISVPMIVADIVIAALTSIALACLNAWISSGLNKI